MKRILLSITCSLLFFTASFAQDGGEKKSVKGTYQIEVHNRRNPPYIPANLEQMVLEARKPDKTSYIVISEYVKIRVLPEMAIKDPGFVPIQNEVVFLLD